MKRVGIIVHLGKPRALELAAKVKEIPNGLRPGHLGAWGGCRSPGGGDLNPKSFTSAAIPWCRCCGGAGGDGTLLHAAGFLAPYDIPMLSVNVWYLGFLSEVEASGGWNRHWKPLISNKFDIEERMLLEAVVEGEDKRERFLAVNDVVITRAAFARMIHLKIDVGRSLHRGFRSRWVDRLNSHRFYSLFAVGRGPYRASPSGNYFGDTYLPPTAWLPVPYSYCPTKW